MNRRIFLSLCVAVFGVSALQAQVSPRTAVKITQSVNEAQLVMRTGNIHPAVYRKDTQDLGPVSDSQFFGHVWLQLQRSPEEEQALQAFIFSLTDPKSPNYHQFSNAAEFSAQFGLASSDLSAVNQWLTGHGLTVNFVYPNLVVDFSGTAKQIQETFHTHIHNLNVGGESHFANVTEPKIPEALAGVVLGPVALHNFKPHVLTHMGIQPSVKNPNPNFTVDASYQLVVPGDLATIYNYNPLYGAGISGQGQTVVLLERTNLYATGDWSTFRKTFGLTRLFPQGNLKTVHPRPSGMINGDISSEACGNPGVVVGDDGEAAVDVEWASASAPNATIELASCADTDTNFGAFIAAENLLTAAAPPPPVWSLSYGSPESENGTDGNAYINSLWQLAVFEGVSVFVSTGDADADVTDQNHTAATHGINVNALASTPNDVAVGGTDYGDTFLGENSVYWSGANTINFNSALSYTPEIPWNDSCASQLIAIALGYPTTYGIGGSCNSAVGVEDFLTTAGGSGGPSGCASGSPTLAGVVTGTCTGYAKPLWQTFVYGNPSDGVRDLPDVSMFAANGVWGHYFVLCYTDAAGGGVPCQAGVPSNWAGAGGTSFGAPIWAGIQALINQATGARQGNPSFYYYLLAGAEYGNAGSSLCNSTLGHATSSACIFYDVTLGDNDTNCRVLNGALYNCYRPSGANGVLSTSNTAYQPAYVTTVGYDFPTGIGTPNVSNLVAKFPGATIP
ncbi:MAG TPA: protease pro-enzyme activation domain-containing protein [Bryobacteraceae bacterium]|nr:protease pro-enzyme activation domain-containing protein [Bryobacteraceae bacterium]